MSEHKPYIAPEQSLKDLTIRAAVAGVVFGAVFGSANAYLGLKVGLTISTSIPVAVLTVVTFRLLHALGFKHSILEANMSQTIGSASSSVASGVLFTIPALFIWGMNTAWRQITALAMCGGLIGVLAMIPLRRYLIKREHGKLPYPEGLACAEVLVAAEGGGTQAAPVFAGIGVGMFFKLLTDGFKVVAGKFQIGDFLYKDSKPGRGRNCRDHSRGSCQNQGTRAGYNQGTDSIVNSFGEEPDNASNHKYCRQIPFNVAIDYSHYRYSTLLSLHDQ